MDLATLMAISPLDGRYQEKLAGLRDILSEYGLMRFRVLVEVRWLIVLANHVKLPELPSLSTSAQKALTDIAAHFSPTDALRIKEIESHTNHDVKAVEYYLKECFAQHPELSPIKEFIHFGCTSEDINNLAYGLMLLEAREQCLLPALTDITTALKKFAHTHAELVMLARTHGQPATPTTVGKEIANVIARLDRQLAQLRATPLLGKMNGASGNYNALAITYPEIAWQKISEYFVTQLGLVWNPYTTQIEPHDYIAEFFAIVQRINTILIDFDRDMWAYIALHYFTQKSVAHEVGSSTMPHKINPIDFENSEGNLGIANALLMHMMEKLPISRWQRDLSDSTVLRNMGVALSHALLAYQATSKGIQKLEPNREKINEDLHQHWEILAEAIQTIMRRYQLEQPYEKLKAFTRGKEVNKELLRAFIAELDLPTEVKQQLLTLAPEQYVGYAKELAREI